MTRRQLGIDLALAATILVLIPYLLPAPVLLMTAAVLLPLVTARLAPALALGLLLALAPLVDGLAAWVAGGRPSAAAGPGSWIEPMALAAGIGLLLRLRRRAGARPSSLPGAGLYTVALACSLALSLVRLLPAWQGKWPAFLLMAWTSLPQAAPMPSEHTLRAGLLLLAGVGWLSLLRRALPADEPFQVPALGWLGGATVAAIYGTWAWGTGHDPNWPYATSLLEDKNSYGAYLVLTLFVALALHARSRHPAVRAFSLLSLAAATWMLLLSGSKIALAAALLAILPLAARMLLRRGRQRAGAVMATTLILIFALSMVIWAGHRSRVVLTLERLTSPVFLRSYVVDKRLPVWSAALHAAASYPVLGLGPGLLYRQLGNFHAAEATGGWRPAHENAHNGFLQLAAETGVVSLVAFLYLLGTLLFSALGRGPAWRGPPGLLALGVLAYLFTMLTGHPLLLSRQTFLFWSALGLLAAMAPQPAAAQASRKPRLGGLWLLLLIPAALIIQPFRPGCAASATSGDGASWDYAAGFHALETDGQQTWRWMKSAGELRLCSSAHDAAPGSLDLTMASLAAPRRVTISGAVSQPTTLQVPVSDLAVRLSTAFPAAGGSLILTSSPGAWPVHRVMESGDGRAVSVRLSSGPDLSPAEAAAPGAGAIP